MAGILSIKRRIIAATNVSKTTRAMQMIAASKLKRSQAAALSSKPYVEKINFLAQGLTRKLEKETLHPYMKKGEGQRDLLIVISPDKGLCGGLIGNLTRELLDVEAYLKNPLYTTIGKKIEKVCLRLDKEVVASFDFGNLLPPFDTVYPITSIIDKYFLNNQVGSVGILSMRFESVFSQFPKVTNLLPITLAEEKEEEGEFTLFEPSIAELLPTLLKRYLEISVYQLLLESYASEQAARMIAMQNATNNANDIIESLKLMYNKERQEKITNEILDITSGTFAYG